MKKEEVDADTIKERILSRISKIEERRKASISNNSNEGVRSFNFDISSIQDASRQDTSMTKNYESPKQPTQNKYLAQINKSRGEENLSDNEEAIYVSDEKAMSTKPAMDYLSVHNISHSTAPKRNLTTYNSNTPDQLNLNKVESRTSGIVNVIRIFVLILY